jgi:hypothetical protein
MSVRVVEKEIPVASNPPNMWVDDSIHNQGVLFSFDFVKCRAGLFYSIPLAVFFGCSSQRNDFSLSAQCMTSYL